MAREYIPSLFDEFNELRSFLQECRMPSLTKAETSGLSLYEDDDHVYIEAAVPGIKPEQIQIHFEKGWVRIQAESSEEKKDVKVHFQSSRKFAYHVPIPVQVDEQTQPEAVCKNGILKITFKKSRAAKPVKIQVKG